MLLVRMCYSFKSSCYKHGRLYTTSTTILPYMFTTDEAVIELAMSIEAQALDLYFRASERTDNDESRKFLLQMADEERSHLLQLGRLIESIIEEGS